MKTQKLTTTAGEAIQTPTHLDATGDCYQSAFDFLINIQNADDSFVLVHGRPVLRRPPFCQYGHAWVEVNGMVIDPEQRFYGPTEIFYALGNIDPALSFKYTQREARRKAVETGVYGPWEGVDVE